MEINERVDIFLRGTGLRQNQIAERLGYSSPYLTRIRRDEIPNLEFFVRLTKEFPNADLNELITGRIINPQVNEPTLEYGVKTIALVEEIETKLSLLKEKLSHK
jgi:transcriptional regulator with XRE-family HTH domain